MMDSILTTGRLTQNEIDWTVGAGSTRIPPLSAPTTPTPLSVSPKLSSSLVNGTLSLEWWVDPANGLSLQNVQFTEGTSSPVFKLGAVHVLARYLQWRNLRLIFDGTTVVVPLTPPPPLANPCTEIVIINGIGERKKIKKQFGFALTATFLLAKIDDPRSAGISYGVTVQYAYLFGMPVGDQEPSGKAHAIKVYPTLTVSLVANGTVPGTPPDIAADLKMVHAPQVTRDVDPTTDHNGERLPAASYKTTGDGFWSPLGVVSFLACDTNQTTRPEPGKSFPPNPPRWDWVFDYLIPGIRNEVLIDAVVYPRAAPGPRPSFAIPWSPAFPSGDSSPGGTLTCFRESGQGEYDNIHITPYLGFDDPTTDDPTKPTAASIFPWIEAPLAADEVIHLHWRWGTGIPTQAIHNNTSPDGFRGWETSPTPPNNAPQSNKIDGAPLIPPNQSLRVKVARSDAAGDNTDDPSSPPAFITTDAVTVWYMATAHQPAIGTYSQFFGQGFGLAMHLEPLSAFGLKQENWELLTHNALLGQTIPNYHDYRWNGGKQRIPLTSQGDITVSRNMLNLPGAPSSPLVTPSTSP